jgi:outer membrane protein OmpA-like peptidoglycan-associated protein
MRCALIRILSCSFCTLATGVSFAQDLVLSGTSTGADVIVEARRVETADDGPLFRAIWRNVPNTGAEFELQRTDASAVETNVMLDRLIEAGIGAYLDGRVHFTREGVKADFVSAQMVDDLNAMMSACMDVLGVDVAFSGLTTPTQQQLDRLLRIDWSQARFGVDGGAEQDKYLAIYYYVRSQRQELERQVHADLLPFAGVAVMGPEEASPGTTIQINSTCGTVFDEQNFLCALDLQLADTGSSGMDPELASNIMLAMADRATAPPTPPVDAPVKVRKRDRWLKQELDAINERIDRMDQRKELWELRDRMDDIDDRLTGVELEVRDVKERDAAASDNPMANLSALAGRNITVHFERNSTALEQDQRVLLNEVFEQLARSQQDKVLITGYTDRSGDAAVNLWLSEQRAKAVRNYLLARGIPAERLLVNYYGDSRSVGRDPGERRVEIEWLR